MARKRTTPAKKKPEPELRFEEGFWWIVNGNQRLNVGRNQRYAENMLAERKAAK